MLTYLLIVMQIVRNLFVLHLKAIAHVFLQQVKRRGSLHMI